MARVVFASLLSRLYYHGTKKRVSYKSKCKARGNLRLSPLPSNKECPTCRKKLVSKRSLRADPNFDRLIEKVCLYGHVRSRLANAC